jgi:hypothetical protein
MCGCDEHLLITWSIQHQGGHLVNSDLGINDKQGSLYAISLLCAMYSHLAACNPTHTLPHFYRVTKGCGVVSFHP